MDNDKLIQRLTKAQQLIQERNFSDGILILEEILSHLPFNYQYRKVTDNAEYIEFWDKEEFLEYVKYIKNSNSEREIYWIANIFPKACYLIAIALMENGNLNDAEKYLIKGLSLESDQPLLLCEMGMLNLFKAKFYNDINYHKEAIKYYYKAFHCRPYITKGLKARALRGIGFSEIELNNYDEAEKCFKESLEYEQNKIALNEILYIQMAKKGYKSHTVTNLSSGLSDNQFLTISSNKEVNKPNKIKSVLMKIFRN